MAHKFALPLFALVVLLARLIKNQEIRKTFLVASNLLLVLGLYYKWQFASGVVIIILIIAHYFLMMKSRVPAIILYVFPLLVLVAGKGTTLVASFGISYLCFRMISAVHELQAELVSRFSLKDYLFYCFFLPTFKLGPIGRLRDHLDSEEEQLRKRITDVDRNQLLRVAYGTVKFIFLAAMMASTVSAFHLDEWKNATHWYDLILMGFCSYVKIYLGFSGFNDVAIGLSHFLGYRMKENFGHPFRARNIGEFWSNWHISLTDLLKETIFYPMNLLLLRKWGSDKKFIVVPLVFFVLYFVIGIWHGLTWNFVGLGFYHAVCAVIAYFFNLGMTKMWKGYRESRLVSVLSIAITQIYISVSFLFFDNNFADVSAILKKVFKIQ